MKLFGSSDHLVMMSSCHFLFTCMPIFFYHLANEDGRFVEEIVPVAVKGKKGPEEFKVDEHPKPNSTIEHLTKLAPVFKKDGTITAANASVRHFCLQNTLFYFY